MARTRNEHYEYVERDGLFRKRVKDATGKYVAIYGETPEDVTKQLIDFYEQRDIDAEEMKDPLFSVYARRWLELNCGNLTKATQKGYLTVLNNHIIPFLDDLRMSEIRPRDIKVVITRAGQMSESVHNKTYMLLKRILTTAYEDRIISTNPCPQMHNGGKKPEEKTALTDKQVEVLLNALEGTRTHLFCMIALYAGLRREEILALKWDCIELDNVPRIEVKRSLKHERNKAVISDQLKTKAARRTVHIPNRLVIELRKAKDSSSSEYVFANRTGGPLSYTQFRHLWHTVESRSVGERTYYKYTDGKKIQFTVKAEKGERAKCRKYSYTIDFEVTPHQLRHTYITNLLLAGTDIKTVQYLAGHEKSKTTLDIYAHLTYNRPEDIIDKVNCAFQNKK